MYTRAHCTSAFSLPACSTDLSEPMSLASMFRIQVMGASNLALSYCFNQFIFCNVLRDAVLSSVIRRLRLRSCTLCVLVVPIRRHNSCDRCAFNLVFHYRRYCFSSTFVSPDTCNFLDVFRSKSSMYFFLYHAVFMKYLLGNSTRSRVSPTSWRVQ